MDAARLRDLADSAFANRSDPQAALADQAEVLAAAARDMAVRFGAGGTLLAFGCGGPTTDAQHISVEFVHPVIVGKPALPAVALSADAATVLGSHGTDGPFGPPLQALAREDDIAVAVATDGDDADVVRGLRVARRRGLLTVALIGGAGGRIVREGLADHVVVVPSTDPHVVKEVHVCAYHVLWELVHVFLADPATRGDGPAPAGAVESLYPSVYGSGTGDDVGPAVLASAREKVLASKELRERVATAEAERLVACAQAMAERFAAGGRLLTCGNGGSSSDAQEVARDHLDGGRDGRALPALCLTNDVALLTALGNDVDFEVVFARQVRALARPADILLGLSTSGSSRNLLRGFAQAADLGLLTIGFAGGDGGAMAAEAGLDHLVVVPSSSVHRIQETQTTCYHVLRELVTAALDA